MIFKKVLIILFAFFTIILNAYAIKKYTWDDIINIKYDKITFSKNSSVYIGNYQDYWIDWSPDSSKIIALDVEDKNIGIHILDLSKMVYGLNNQNIFVPFDDFVINKPIIWKAKIKTEAMRQGAPSWSKYDNIVGYIEYDETNSNSILVIVDIEKDFYKEINFKELPKIDKIDFSWDSNLILLYGANKIIIYDFIEYKIIKEITLSHDVIQAGWFPDDKNILIIYNDYSYKYNLDSSKEEKFFEYTHWSKVSFIPNTDELVIAVGGGIIRYNYITKEGIPLTQGVHYQPQVSKDGKLFSYISETPWGGFITSTELKKPK